MKARLFFVTLFLCLGLTAASVSVSSCSVGARVGSVGAGAHVG